jgi:hypothetical protein
MIDDAIDFPAKTNTGHLFRVRGALCPDICASSIREFFKNKTTENKKSLKRSLGPLQAVGSSASVSCTDARDVIRHNSRSDLLIVTIKSSSTVGSS